MDDETNTRGRSRLTKLVNGILISLLLHTEVHLGLSLYHQNKYVELVQNNPSLNEIYKDAMQAKNNYYNYGFQLGLTSGEAKERYRYLKHLFFDECSKDKVISAHCQGHMDHGSKILFWGYFENDVSIRSPRFEKYL